MIPIEMKKEIKTCDECESEFYSEKSEMKSLCPNCSHFIYGYDNCEHVFINARCIKCYWNDSTTDFIKSIMNANFEK